MFLGCVGVVLYFKKSSNMEAAYGLAIIMTMHYRTTYPVCQFPGVPPGVKPFDLSVPYSLPDYRIPFPGCESRINFRMGVMLR